MRRFIDANGCTIFASEASSLLNTKGNVRPPRGKPYLVGERGPELFVPGASGRIEANNALRRLTADGAAAVAGSTSTSSTRTYSLNPTINIMGGDDPREIAGQVRAEMERYMRAGS
jgi:hypothetical protein